MRKVGREQVEYEGRIWLNGYFKMKDQGAGVTTKTVYPDSLHLYGKDKAGVSALYYREDAQVEHELLGTGSGFTGDPGSVLFLDSLGSVDTDAHFTWDNTAKTLNLGDTSAEFLPDLTWNSEYLASFSDADISDIAGGAVLVQFVGKSTATPNYVTNLGVLDSWEFATNRVRLNLKTDERNLRANFPSWPYLKSEWFQMDPEFDREIAPLVYGKHDSTALNLDHGMVPTVPVWINTSSWFATNLGPATFIKDVYVTDSSTTTKQIWTADFAPGNDYEKVYGSLAGGKTFTVIEFINAPSTDKTVTADLYGYSLAAAAPYNETNTMTNPVNQMRHFLVNFAVTVVAVL